MSNLSTHRALLLNRFGKKIINSKRFCSWLKPQIINNHRSRRMKSKLQEILCKKERYKNSAIPSVIKNLNEDPKFQIPPSIEVERILKNLGITI
jgi:hypothetical protein